MLIGNYIILTKHFWKLYNIYEGKSELITNVLNPKNKQSNELAE